MESTKKGLYRWGVLAILVAAFTSTFFSRFVWSPLIGAASGEVGMSMADAGNLMSAFYFGYLFTQLPGGYLADRFKPKFFLFGLVAMVGVMTFAMSYIQSYAIAYAVRFIGGFFGGAIMAFCSRMLSNYFEPKERGVAFGILLASPSIGTLLANQIGPRVMNASGWRAAFQVTGVIILVVAVLILLVIKNPKDVAQKTGEKVTLLDGIKNYFSNKQLVLMSIAGFLFMAIPAGFSTWANRFMVSPEAGAGITATQAGMVMTVYAIVSIVGSMASGVIGKKFRINPKTFIMVVYLCCCASILFFSACRSFGTLLLSGAVFGLFSCASSTQITTWAVNIGGNKYAGTTSSLQNLLFQSSNVIFPTIAGSIIDSKTVDGVVMSYSGVWYMYAALLVAAFAVMIFTNKQSAADSMK
ncbi:MFS transporter [Eubacteriales bacterium OttesenSCG-928-A19]|nr:MFS transporter [Eubacteriales bacterium OttesenSCG-928-A19]